MSEYTFRPTLQGGCPECKVDGYIYYICDRHVGGECYEYALHRKPILPPKKRFKFKDYESMVEFLGIKGNPNESAESLIKWCGRYCSFSCQHRECGDWYVNYLAKEIIEKRDPQIEVISYWGSYQEILKWSKEYLSDMEPKQMTLEELWNS